MTLSSEIKQSIREEEVFRQEVRDELARMKPESWRTKIWSFLNSSVGIFLLSSVLVSGVTWRYAKWTEERERERKEIAAQQEEGRARSRALGTLKTEIANRFVQFSWIVDTKAGPDFSYSDVLTTFLGPPDMAPDGYAFGMFPEYRPFSYDILYEQLRILVGTSDRSRLDGLGKLYPAVSSLRRIALDSAISKDPDKLKDAVKKATNDIYSGLHTAVPVQPGWDSAWPVFIFDLQRLGDGDNVETPNTVGRADG